MKLWLLALRAAWSVPDCRGQTASPLSPAYLEPGVEAQPTRRSADAISPEGIGADVPVAREHEDVSAIGGTLWEALDESSVAELPAYKEVVEERALIRVTDAAAGWIVGQRIAIPVPQINEVYTPVIERIEPGPSGVRSYVGTLTEVAGRPHRFTITVGPRNMFG